MVDVTSIPNQSKMSPFFIEDYDRLLQKTAVIEMKIYWLEMNVEINAVHGHEMSLLMFHNSEKTRKKLTSTTKKQNSNVNEH